MSNQPSARWRAWRRSFTLSSVIRTATTWPPEKPISIRPAAISKCPVVCGSLMSLRRLNYLGQHPAGGLRMDEGNPRVADARARLGVDQLDTGLLELAERSVDVLDGIGDVVKSGALPLQVPADRRVSAERAQQLHVPIADVEQNGLHSLALHSLTVGDGHPESLLV